MHINLNTHQDLCFFPLYKVQIVINIAPPQAIGFHNPQFVCDSDELDLQHAAVPTYISGKLYC